MTSDDHDHSSSILRYMMPAFPTSAEAQATSLTRAPLSSSDLVPTKRSSPAPVRPIFGQQSLSYGTSSLFLTDYEKHDWLGYGQQYKVDGSQNRELTRCTSRSSISSMLNQGQGSCSILPSEESSPQTPDRQRGHGYTISDSGFSPWGQDTFDASSGCVTLTGKETDDYSQGSTYSQASFDPFSPSQWSPSTHQFLGNMRMPPSTSLLSPPAAEHRLFSKGETVFQHQHPLQMPFTPMSPAPSETTTPGRITMFQSPQAPLTPFDPNRLALGNDGHLSSLRSASSHQLSGYAASSELSLPSRYLKVSNVSRDMSIWVARDAFKHYGDLKGIFTTFLGSDGIIFLEFFDLRHAMNASKLLYTNTTFDASINVQFCSKFVLCQVSPDILENDNEGCIVVSFVSPRLNDNDLLRMLSSYGEIQSFQTDDHQWPPMTLVEYYDIRHAAMAKAALQDLHNNKQIHCQVSFYQTERSTKGWPYEVPGPFKMSRSPSTPEVSVGGVGSFIPSTMFHRAEPIRPCSPTLQMRRSPTSWPATQGALFPQHATSQSDAVNKGKISWDALRQWPDSTFLEHPPGSTYETAMASEAAKEERRSSPTSESSGTASVLIESVNDAPNSSTSQVDKRTTFMIRNIPNKYTQQMLLECINETHFGKFDFLYLRMDFKNKCNVGYAFINFINTDVVASFAKQHVGKKWSRFNSDKICSLSYANIQGRQALIEKFRNSSVMEEEPSYRPKIFYTSGPNVGLEEPFPEANVVKDTTRGPMRRRFSNGRQNEF